MRDPSDEGCVNTVVEFVKIALISWMCSRCASRDLDGLEAVVWFLVFGILFNARRLRALERQLEATRKDGEV